MLVIKPKAIYTYIHYDDINLISARLNDPAIGIAYTW
jgi:hypothetical protein